VNLLGHRKRIIASLADRPYEEPPAKPPRFSQLRVSHCVSLPGRDVCTERARQRPGCFLLPWLSFTFLPFFQRTKPGSVRNDRPLSDWQLSSGGGWEICRGDLLRAQVLGGYLGSEREARSALLCCFHAQEILPSKINKKGKKTLQCQYFS